ncbi:butyrate kinase [Clostridium sporogenes]|jgi:butyrate kinase|uniref:Probable butyrate kinase n=1 Tax=Clostridium sporogenes TaxID=1509 RepID=A0A7X5SYP0_CLOSG|nr:MULTISPECIES: butyrate kinase [Clostridium]AJD33101.1 butyrate kinase [Clostridium botulinum Prevot_594]AVP61871.1 butyrate kinase [Clostridium botulinum]AKC64280.1 putative butyrate kinase 1 [Clostridium sporogenes]AKJ91401.1 butyrate kinase [Clostridium sporogenes]KCZ66768.1 putative butyrate kinase 1 [Clostridium sporogenes]
MSGNDLILVINPGSTSTKIALFNKKNPIITDNLFHSLEEINKYDSIYEQKGMREKIIMKWLEEKGVDLRSLVAIVGRGGLLRPMPGGTYKVTKKMLEDLKIGYQGQHASNLGGIIAYDISEKLNIPSFIVDPVAVDEILEKARISGMPEIKRRSLVHALNIKAVTRKVCKKIDKDFYNSSFVVAHLGGGISICPIKNGKILDVNNANEEGPFSPERTGNLPVGDLIKIAYSSKYSYKELKKKIMGKGGLIAYLDTNDGRVVDRMIEEGNRKAELILKAMAYQIAKEIGSMATVLKGNIDAIILTGGLAYNKRLTTWIKERVEFISPIELVPGEEEMLALVEGAIRILNKEESAKIYEEEVCFND